jgi:1-acyl-sn-glycerol-3-phosphate acyltransferase
MLYWLAKYVFIGPLLRITCRPRVHGLENLPETGPAILASNHLAVVDSFFLALMVPRRLTFLAKSEYFTAPGPAGWLKKMFFAGVGQVPIDRSSAQAAESALLTGVGILREGKLLGIYPEGTRSPDGRLYKGKSGLAILALEAAVPVIPVVMVGTDRVNPLGSRMWRPARVEVVIGHQLDFSRYADVKDDRFVQRSVTDEVMHELMRMSGQEYVDVYAATLKNKPADETGAATDKAVRHTPDPAQAEDP